MADSERSAAAAPDHEPPEDFVRLLRDALSRLYEPAHLLRHPLVPLLATVLPQLGDPAQNLREFLLDAIEKLEPLDHARASEREHRPYLVLVDRYVGGFTPEEIQARLHISSRQFRREHHVGLQALAASLWKYCPGYSATSVATSAGSLDHEVESLRAEIEALPLAWVLSAARAPAEALARHANVAIVWPETVGDLACLADRTLAKQGLLSALSVLADRQLVAIEVSALLQARVPCLRLGLRPALAAGELEQLQRDLSDCTALMSAQGGAARLGQDDERTCSAVHLLFRPALAEHILVVDDNERMLRLYERYLASGRYRVSVAASAAEAEASMSRSAPDLIILDVMMKDVDGWELLQRLRSGESPRDVPILVCSVLNEPKLALALGAQAFVRKPVAPDELLANVRQLLAACSRPERSPAGS